MKDLREELEQLSLDLDFIQQEYCSEDEEKVFKKIKKDKIELPADIETSSELANYGQHFRYVKTDLSDDEIKKLILYRQTKYLYSIKNSLMFFVVLAIISIIFAYLSSIH